MKLPNIMGFVGVVKTFASAHRPEILLGAAVTSTIASTALAAKGGYEAGQKVLKAEFSDLDLDSPEGKTQELSVKEKAQLTWTNYLPAGVALTTSLGSTAGLHLVHVKEKKALVTAGAVALEELKTEYRKWEKENTIGVMSEEEKQAVLEERLHSDPEGTLVMNSDHEIEAMYLVRDGMTQRDIWSNQHRIEEAVIDVNSVIAGSGNVELNYFYTKAGFGTIPDGNNIGWSGALIDIKWEETVRDDGRPVRMFIFRPSPEKGFDDAHG